MIPTQRSSSELARVVAVAEGVKAVVRDAFDVELLARNAMVQAHHAGAEARGFGEVSRSMGAMSRELDAAMRGMWELAGTWVSAVTERLRRDRVDRYFEQAIAALDGDTAEVRARRRREHAEVAARADTARAALHERIEEVARLAAMGWVLARSARIEATYGRERREVLTDLSLEFARTADHIYDALKDLRSEVSRVGRRAMKKAHTLFQDDGHRWLAIARDPERADHVIDTNEYLVVDGDDAILTDPGGLEIFPAVFTAVSAAHDVRTISRVFASHQDPDVISSLGLWLEWNPAIQCYLSWLWTTFIPHFGGKADTFIALPDEGMSIPLGKSHLEALPAHFLHSPGNFHLYDPRARILFSGDVGAALLPPGATDLFVTDFDRHIQLAAGFHARWMGTPEARDAWCQRVSDLRVDMLCPQHGAIYRGEDVARFVDWFSKLRLGVLRSGAVAQKVKAA